MKNEIKGSPMSSLDVVVLDEMVNPIEGSL